MIIIIPVAVMVAWFLVRLQLQKRQAKTAIKKPPVVATPAPTTPTSKSFPGWAKALLATAMLLIIIFWGGEILSALRSWDWSTTNLGKAIDDATSPGCSNLIWLFLLVPLYFFLV